MNKLFESLNGFYDKLQDDLSRAYFDMRFEYFIDRNVGSLEEKLINVAPKNVPFGCGFLDRYFLRHPENKGKPFVIFGSGNAGKTTIRTLKYMDIVDIVSVVDNNKALWGNSVCDITIESPNVICEKYDDCVIYVAVANMLQQIKIYYQLINMGVKDSNIFLNEEAGLFCEYGLQYFDLPELVPDPDGEIFVDAGCYDGVTSLRAEKWVKGNLKKVYAFEADKRNIEKCRGKLEKLNCEYVLYDIATWECEDVLRFEMNENFSYASGINTRGKAEVKANSIDNVLRGEKATYIKLDVEGAELETLKGAKNTIQKYKPKMAISLYHKPEDIVEIPSFLELLGMDYKYYIRHYQSRRCETVLYAI